MYIVALICNYLNMLKVYNILSILFVPICNYIFMNMSAASTFKNTMGVLCPKINIQRVIQFAIFVGSSLLNKSANALTSCHLSSAGVSYKQSEHHVG